MPSYHLSLIFIGTKTKYFEFDFDFDFELKIGGLVKSDLFFTKLSGIDPHENVVVRSS